MSDEISNFGQWAKILHAIMEGSHTDSDIQHITGSLIVLISFNYIKSCLRSVSMLTYKVMNEKEKKVKERKKRVV